MKNGYESLENMQRMQQEAMRRVKEMQKRAKQSIAADINQNYTINDNKHKDNLENNPKEIDKNSIITNQINSNIKSSKLKNNFDFFSNLLNDQEKSLILILILLLIEEKSDISLIIALMYLMM